MQTLELQVEQDHVESLGKVRNPLAHEPKMEWNVSEQDALDILTTISFVHRKLDRAHPWSSRIPKYGH